jgi:magnesium chelatase family protein
VVLGERSLDGSLMAVSGALPAAIAANGREMGLICPKARRGSGLRRNIDILAPDNSSSSSIM